MANETQILADALQTAVRFEQQGRAFYLAAAERVPDGLVRTVLNSLAADEAAHAALILQYARVMQQTQGWPPVADEAAGALPEELQRALETTAGAVSSADSLRGIHAKARELEQQSLDFYSARAAEAQDPALVRLLRFLTAGERTHLQALDLLIAEEEVVS